MFPSASKFPLLLGPLPNEVFPHMKICLFTAHSPITGGGAVILRSLVGSIVNVKIDWHYLSDNPAKGYEAGHLGRGFMGGPIVQDIAKTFLMLNGGRLEEIEGIVGKLLDLDCDGYWVVSHNEGLRIAYELATRQKRKPVHLTIHDDWSGALCARSVRYRLLSGFADSMTVKAIQAVDNFDVISKGMQEYYLDITGKQGAICHRYIPSLPPRDAPFNPAENTDALQVGHIGSIYSEDLFFAFCKLLKEYSNKKGILLKVHVWGHRFAKPNPFPENIVSFNTSQEEVVVRELAKCRFVYCMYPFQNRYRTFCRTSLPTKLSTYVLAGRPILGHGPIDSSIADFIADTRTGAMLSGNGQKETFRQVEEILTLNVCDMYWQNAAAMYFGRKNLRLMESVFGPTATERQSI